MLEELLEKIENNTATEEERKQFIDEYEKFLKKTKDDIAIQDIKNKLLAQ